MKRPLLLPATLLSAALFVVATPAHAQGLKEGEPDIGGWLDEPEAADPLAGPSAGSPAPAPQAEEAPVDPAAERRRQRQIDKNYDDAQSTYQEVLSADQLEPLERRIAANERIVKEQQVKIDQARAERRQLQVDLFNRALYLKQQREKGQITADAYAKLIQEEETKSNERSEVLKQDIALWTKEIKAAQVRLDDLQSQRRMLLAARPRQRKTPKQAAAAKRAAEPGAELLATLEQRMRKLARYSTRNTLSGVHPRDLGEGGRRMRDVRVEDGADERVEAEVERDEVDAGSE